MENFQCSLALHNINLYLCGIFESIVFSALKRSLRRLCPYMCLSVHRSVVVSQHALQVLSQHALQVSRGGGVYPSMP